MAKVVRALTGFKATSMFFDEQKRFQVVVGGANDVHGDLVGKLFDFAANQNLVKEGKCENKKKNVKTKKNVLKQTQYF
jgi:hypothetical protein